MPKCIPLEGEPEFTLLARDRSAPAMVRQWAYERERQVAVGEAPESDLAKIETARMVATQMEAWRATHDGAWRKPVVVREPTLNDTLMTDILDGVRKAIETGAFGDRTVRVAGVDVKVTVVDLDTQRIHEVSRCAGEFAVDKDAVLSDKTDGMAPRGAFGQYPLPNNGIVKARVMTLDELERMLRDLNGGKEAA